MTTYRDPVRPAVEPDTARQLDGLAALAALAQPGMTVVRAAPAPTREIAPRRQPTREIAPRRQPTREIAPRRQPTREIAPRQQERRRRQHRRMTAFFGAMIVLLLAAAAVLSVTWPPARYLISVAWMMPIVELTLLGIGQLHYRLRGRVAPGKYHHLIIQITTTGREHGRVSEIIRQIRGYHLTMAHQIWVVLEPGHNTQYPDADRVVVVPRDFTSQGAAKARALEWSRLVRHTMGLERGDVKILFCDDDVSLTRQYIERAFIADYDICEGVVTPRTAYAIRPFWHFAVSHADDIRTHACLVYCSVFQGILNRPLHVHGEGLTVTGEAEGLLTWDMPLVASEDLAFGQRAAARRHGFRWGWFHEYAEVTSPWTFHDYLQQRSRWLWGDIHAVLHRDVMPLGAAARVSIKYVAGALGLICSVAGLYLRLSGRIPADAAILNYAKLSILAWIAVIFACGWVGAGSATSARNDESRLLAGVTAVLMMPISVLLTFTAIVLPLLGGNPGVFITIRKTR